MLGTRGSSQPARPPAQRSSGALPVGEVKRETLRRGSARQGNEIIISDENNLTAGRENPLPAADEQGRPWAISWGTRCASYSRERYRARGYGRPTGRCSSRPCIQGAA